MVGGRADCFFRVQSTIGVKTENYRRVQSAGDDDDLSDETEGKTRQDGREKNKTKIQIVDFR